MTKIGFLQESEPLAFTVRDSVIPAFEAYPHVELVMPNGDLCEENVDALIEAQVDVGVILSVDEDRNLEIGQRFANANIPLIGVEIPIPMSVYYGIDNKIAGYLMGEVLGRWINRHWHGILDQVLVLGDHRHLPTIRKRLSYAVKKLTHYVRYCRDDAFQLDTGSSRQIAHERVGDVLARWQDKQQIAIICDDDQTALGALDAARALWREGDVVIVGQGAKGSLGELERPDSHLIGSVDFHNTTYGEGLADLALRLAHGENVPRHNTITPIIRTSSELETPAGVG